MVAKFSPGSLRRYAILLTILALLHVACVGAVSVVMDSNGAKPETLDHAQGRQLRGFQGNRILMTFADDSEDRAIIDAVEKIAQAAKNRAITNKFFNKLQIQGIDEKSFQSTQFEKWAATVTKNFKKNTERAQAWMASTLASRFGDDALAALLITAKLNYESRTAATQLQNAQLQNWESTGKTVDDGFALLKLNNQGEKLFESPLAPTWMSYVTRLESAGLGRGYIFVPYEIV